jgi:hypothetical protein
MVMVGTTSQGGTHYRTLCETCNNTLLGSYYDPSLVSLSNEITSLSLGAKRKTVSLPRKIYPFIRPQRVARSVVGHTLAGLAVNETRKGLLDSPINSCLREYFLDESAGFPIDLEIYYWLYPSRKQVLVKNMGKSIIAVTNKREVIFGHVFKFLPLGFWLVWKGSSQESGLVKRLVEDKKMPLDEVKQIEIDLYNIPPLDFPEVPVGDDIIALNREYAVSAKEKSI